MILKCMKCGYTTKNKSHFTKHLNKLNPCSNEVVEYDNETWSKSCNNPKKIDDENDLKNLTKEQLIEIINKLV